MSVFVPVPHRFDYCSFVVLSEGLGELCGLSSPPPPAPPRIALAILSLSWLHIHFFYYSSSVKNVMGDLVEITLNLKIAFGSITILTVLIFLIEEHGISFHFFELSSVLY